MALNQTQVSQLFVVLFGRAGEGEGNRFWQQGADIATVAEAMLATDAAATYFGTAIDDNADFIKTIFANTFGYNYTDSADIAAGMDFWIDALNSGSYTRGQIVASMIESATTIQNDAPTNASQQFTNRVAVADYMAENVETPAADYATSTKFGVGLIVTHDTATVTAAQASIDGTQVGQTFALTANTDILTGTSGSDTFDASTVTDSLGAGDVIVDSNRHDNDVVTAAYTDDADLGTIVAIENVTVNVTALTTAGTAGTFESDMGSVINSDITVNLLQAGGITAVSISDVGSGTSVTAGTRVGALTVDYTAAVSDVAVTGGTGATVVNGTASKVTGLTVDASAGTSVDVEFGASSSNVTVISGSTTVDVNNGAGAKVTNLVIDATLAESTIDIDTVAGSSVTLTTTEDAGAITLVSTNVTGSNDTATVTAAADLSTGIDGFETLTLTTVGAAGTVTTDSALKTLTATATANALTIDAQTSPLTTVALNGSKAIQLQVSGALIDSTDVLTLTTDTADKHSLSIEVAQAAAIDLSKVSTDVQIDLGIAMAVAATGKITVADGANVLMSAAQTNAIGVVGKTSGATVNVDISTVNHSATQAYTNVGTLVISSTGDNTNAFVATVDSNTTGTQGNIVLTGTGDIVLGSATDAASITSTDFSGNLTMTLAATNGTLTAGSGDDTLVLVADHSGDTISFTNFEILDIDGATVVLTAAQISGKTAVLNDTTNGGGLTINGTAAADSIDLSGITVNTNLLASEVVVDAGAGNDTITLGATGMTISYSTGTDGMDTITGFTAGATAGDVYDTDYATSVAFGVGVIAAITAAEAAVTLDTSADAIFTLDAADFRTAITDFTSGTQVLTAISETAVLVDTTADKLLLALTSSAGDTYIYEVTEGADGDVVVAAADITLVATLVGVDSADLVVGNFA